MGSGDRKAALATQKGNSTAAESGSRLAATLENWTCRAAPPVVVAKGGSTGGSGRGRGPAAASSGGKTEYECVHCGHTSTLGKMNMAYLNIHTALECTAAPADVRLQVVRTTGSQHVVRKARNTAWYRQALEDEESRKAGPRKVQRRVTPPPTSSSSTSSSHRRSTKPPSVTLGAPTKSTGRASPQTMANESPVDPERVKRINASLLGALNQFDVPLELVDSPRFRDFVICLNREYAPFVASAWMLMQTKTSGRPPSSGGGGAAIPAAVAPALAVLAEAATAGTGSGSGRSGAGKGTKRARASDGDNKDSGKAKKRYIKEEMVRSDDDDSSSSDDDSSIDRTKAGYV
jgi:hypothetical protein